MTQTARASLLSLLSRHPELSLGGLRLAVKKGGCAGLQYEMKVTDQLPGDIQAGDSNARLYIAPDAVSHLEGMTLDYAISLTDSGFKIRNPNAARSCGCGTSFEPKAEVDTEGLQEGDPCKSENIGS